MGFSDDTNPIGDVVSLHLPDSGIEISNWTRYSFNSHFLTPTDAWSFTLEGESIDQSLINKLAPGSRVTLTVNGHVNGDGYIDAMDLHCDRGGGTQLTIEGRDRLAMAVDGCVDPKTQFSRDMTLYDVVKRVFTPYGWSDDNQFLISNETNANVISGQKRGRPLSKGKKPKELKSFTIHQLKPYASEGAFAFASRICQRHGLMIWLSAEGNFLIIGKPDFNQETRHILRRARGANGESNNILAGGKKFDLADQPSIIIATGYGAGAEFQHSKLKVAMKNPAVSVDVSDVLAKHPDAFLMTASNSPTIAAYKATPVTVPRSRPVFLHDDESKTIEQLKNFVLREMSLRLRKSMTCRYTVEGHTNNGSVWCVDSIVDVHDDIAGVNEPMWVLSRTLTKSRSEGTRTEVELIRPGTLVF